MPVAWFFAPYKKATTKAGDAYRYCAIDDFTQQIVADPEYAGGAPWSACECLGDTAVVKVRASQALLDTINAAPGMLRIPVGRLNDPLSSLTGAQRTAIQNKLLVLGYTNAELTAALGNNLGSKTLGDVLRFALTRRQRPRYDGTNFILEDPIQPTRPVEDADADVV